jgi:hydroxyacylglutathione hydrolase
MFLRMLYDEKLAQAAYIIGCQQTGEAIVVDPERDVDRYVELARRKGMRIVAVAETHIHADFLSGARELADQTRARVYVSDEGGPEWKYQWLGSYDHRLLRHGDTFTIGKVGFSVIHTPGHTPEHICFVVTDHGGGASDPMGVLTGDFVFVGDLGRPDLLETAAGQAGASEPSARRLYESVRRFTEMPDYLQIWPGHGAGSACGKALGAVPQTTVGYEKRFNPSICAAASELEFVRYILADQPEPPPYFARMKRENRLGPQLLGKLPTPTRLPVDQLASLAVAGDTVVIDTRPWPAFRAGHLPGALFIGQDGSFPTVAGSYIEPETSVLLIADAARVDEAVRDLVRVGLDRIQAFATPEEMRQFAAGGGVLAATSEIDAPAVHEQVESRNAFVLDVRSRAEFAAGHIPKATNIAYPLLPRQLDLIPRDQPIIVNCRSGGRSARATAFLQRAGYTVSNLAGGMSAWEQSGLPVDARPPRT